MFLIFVVTLTNCSQRMEFFVLTPKALAPMVNYLEQNISFSNTEDKKNGIIEIKGFWIFLMFGTWLDMVENIQLLFNQRKTCGIIFVLVLYMIGRTKKELQKYSSIILLNLRHVPIKWKIRKITLEIYGNNLKESS